MTSENNLVCLNQLVHYKKLGIHPKNVLLLHGWGASCDVWGQIAPEIEKAKFGVVMPDLPGFGESEPPRKTFDTSDYAAVIMEFIKKLKLPAPIILAGHSFGGKIALKIAHDNPEIVKKLVLMDSAGAGQRNLLKLGALKLVSRAMKQFFKLPLLKNFEFSFKRLFYSKIGAEDYVNAGGLRETFLKIIKEDFTPILPEISAETVILWGESDKETPLADAEKFRHLIKNSKLVIIKDAGHYPFADDPQTFLKEFLNAVSQSNLHSAG